MMMAGTVFFLRFDEIRKKKLGRFAAENPQKKLSAGRKSAKKTYRWSEIEEKSMFLVLFFRFSAPQAKFLGLCTL